MTIHDLETPALVVDLDVFENNLRRMGDYCRKHKLNLRSHTKTHKCPEIARLQVAQGFPGITCAKVGEAEVMIEHGMTDILIAFPIVGNAKVQRLCNLAKKAKIAVALDSIEAAEWIAHEAVRQGVTIEVLTEINVGLNRVGVETAERLLELAEKIHRLKGIRLRGIACYPGQIFCKPTEQELTLKKTGELILDLRARFRAKGLDESWVSAGSTPTAYQSHWMSGITEIRPGMYVFNDRNLLGAEVCTSDQCALHVITTVVSTAVTHRAMMDGGSKTFSSDRYIPGNSNNHATFGLVREDEKIVFYGMSEEHGHLNVEYAHQSLQVGQRLKILPNHVCPTVNLHDQMYGIRREKVELTWKILGRGKVQ